MATRVEAVLADIEAEMVARGVEVTHYWGKRLAEARKTVNWVSWTEDDDAETVEPAYANSYELEADGATLRGQRRPSTTGRSRSPLPSAARTRRRQRPSSTCS